MKFEKIVEKYGNGITLEEALKERGLEEIPVFSKLTITEEEKELLQKGSHIKHNVPRELLEEDEDIFDA